MYNNSYPAESVMEDPYRNLPYDTDVYSREHRFSHIPLTVDHEAKPFWRYVVGWGLAMCVVMALTGFIQ